jgi:hypothetical protein
MPRLYSRSSMKAQTRPFDVVVVKRSKSRRSEAEAVFRPAAFRNAEAKPVTKEAVRARLNAR